MTNDDLFAGIDDPDPSELLEIEAEAGELGLLGQSLEPEFEEPSDLGRAVGRLGAPGPDDDVPRDGDDEADAIAWSEADASTGSEPESTVWSADADDLSAEEAAVHVTYDPEFGESGDGYLR